MVQFSTIDRVLLTNLTAVVDERADAVLLGKVLLGCLYHRFWFNKFTVSVVEHMSALHYPTHDSATAFCHKHLLIVRNDTLRRQRSWEWGDCHTAFRAAVHTAQARQMVRVHDGRVRGDKFHRVFIQRTSRDYIT